MAASFSQLDGVTITGTATTSIGSATITIPAPGTVIAQVSGEAFFNNGSAANTMAEIELWVCSAPGVSCAPGRSWFRLQHNASDTLDPSESFYAANEISFATAGRKTIHLNGHAVSAGDNVQMTRLKYLLLYVPALTP